MIRFHALRLSLVPAGPLLAGLVLAGGCSTGPRAPQVVEATSAPVHADAVRLYFPSCKPAAFDTVARLDASKLGNFSSYAFNRRWIQQLRGQAAVLGANGLLLIPRGRAATFGAEEHGPAFKALAIRLATTPTPGTAPWAASCDRAAKQLDYRVFHRSTGLAGKQGGG